MKMPVWIRSAYVIIIRIPPFFRLEGRPLRKEEAGRLGFGFPGIAPEFILTYFKRHDKKNAGLYKKMQPHGMWLRFFV